MRVELSIDRNEELLKGVAPALEKELVTRLQVQVGDCTPVIRRAGSDGLSVRGGEKEAKKKVEEILQQTWESADDWFY
ncbi:DinI-like family protein [Leclercia sp. H6W5]|uniref:DinI-like family protein n=1 Tax=Leclercia tamurae TaxID=2926467 RepID=UPI0021D1B6E3|nr:DinI-like family protein [Leclercia tamurae]MCU6683839.1 DinI-like family protein [Leclercia tamurae]